jgi:hypothetical protein
MAGAPYVLAGLTSVIGGMYIPGKLVVRDDAATTANAILAHKHLFELGFAIMLIAVVCSIILTALFYDLFNPVNKTLFNRSVLSPRGTGYFGCSQPSSTRSRGCLGRRPLLECP